MKKWMASFMILSLVLAACGNDDGDSSKNHESSKTEKHTSNDKKDQPTEETSKTKKDKAPAHDDSNQSSEDSNSNASNNNERQGDTSNNVQENDNSTTKQGGSYVAPYHGQNVVPVAQNIARQSVNQQQALKQLPNFQTSLDAAQREVTQLNGQQNPYNDYAIQGEAGNYRYIFSFINQSQPGTYMIVTVDRMGQPKIVDPTYRQ